MQIRKTTLIGLAAGACVATAAFGGLRLSGGVYVDTTSNYASGYLGSAYNSNSNYNEFIGCTVYSSPGYTYGSCYAADAAGTSRGCYTTAPEIVAGIRGIDANSNMSFTWDGSGYCTSVAVGQWSYTNPKVWGGAGG